MIKQLFDFLYSGSYIKAVSSILQPVGKTLLVFCICFFILRTLWSFIRGEITSFDALISFIAEKGLRFIIIALLFSPFKFGDINTGGSPLCIYMFKYTFDVSIGTANIFSKAVYGETFENLPKALKSEKIKERIQQHLNKIKFREKSDGTVEEIVNNKYVYKHVPLSPTTSSGSKVSKFAQILGGIALWGLSIATSIVLPGLAIPAIIAGFGGGDALIHYGTYGNLSNSLIMVVRNIMFETVMPVTILLSFYFASIVYVIRLLIYIPFFGFSIFLFIFDKTKDSLSSNLTKVLGLLLHPLAIAIGFYLSTEASLVFKEKILSGIMESTNLGFFGSLILCLSVTSVIKKIFSKTISATENFVDSLLNISSTIMHSSR